MSLRCATCLSAACADQLANPASDFALYSINSGSIFLTDTFTIPRTCPPGFRCQPGPPIIINTLPPIIPQNGVARINCCQAPLTAIIPAGSTQSQIQAIISNLFYQCALQAAACQIIGGGPGGIPPPAVPIVRGPGGPRPVNVCNTQQCYTAFCSALPGGSITVCTPQGTFCQEATSGSPNDIAVAQGIANNWAQENAQQSATQQASAACTVCNAFLHEVQSCPGNPGQICSLSIQASTYCAPLGTNQSVVDSQASQALANQLAACLTAQGCACPGPTVSGGVLTGDACGEFYHVYLGTAIPNNFIGDIFTDSTHPYNPANQFGPGAGLVTLTPFNNPYNVVTFFIA